MKKFFKICSICIIGVSLLVGCKTPPPTEKQEENGPEENAVSPAAVKPSKQESPQVLFANKLNKLLAKNKIQEALNLFETESPELTKTRPMQNLKLSLLISNNNMPEAKALASSLEEQNPSDTDTLLAQSMIAAIEHDKAKETAYLKKIVKLEPNNTPALLQLADNAFYNKSYVTARKYYIKALSSDKKNTDALVGLGNVYYMQGDFPNAETQLTAALKLDPKNADVYASLARVQFEQNKVLPAIENINKALKLDNEVINYWLDKGTYCIRANKKPEALAAYSKVIALDDQNYIAYIYRAGLNNDLGKQEAAISDYKKVLEIYPDYYFAAEELGVLYFIRGEYENARMAFITALQKATDNTYYALMATLCYYQMDNVKAGKNFIEKYLPYIDRQTKATEYYVARLFADNLEENSVLAMVNKVKDGNKKNKMQFYVAKFYELVRKSDIAEKLYLEISSSVYPAFFEYRLVEAELSKRGLVPKSLR